MKKCSKGKSCGVSCINANKTCRKDFSGKVSDFLDRYNPSSKDASSSGLTAEDLKAFPDGKKNEIVRTNITSAGTKVSASIGSGEIAFSINDRVGVSHNTVKDPIGAGKLALTEAKGIIKGLPDGTLVKAAPIRDSAGAARIRVYQKLGFGEVIGGTQWAIKMGDRLIPVDGKFFEEELRPNDELFEGYGLKDSGLSEYGRQKQAQENLKALGEEDEDFDLGDLFE
jgi:hypothetical protein